MKKKILMFLSLFLILGCAKHKNDFQRFEISYSDGRAERFSVVIWNDGILEVKLLNENGENEVRGIKLLRKEFEIFKKQIDKIRIKDINYECIDCSIVSIEIEKNKKIYKVFQKGKLSTETINLIDTLRKIIHNPKLYYLLPRYKYKTADEIIQKVKLEK